MNSSAPRKTPSRRSGGASAPQASGAPSVPMPPTSAGSKSNICLVFLDDRSEFLDGISNIAEHGTGICVHGFHTATQTNFRQFLIDLLDKGERPDALLIDLVLADSAEGQSGIDYLRQIRQESRLLGLPTVIATSAGEGEGAAWNEEEYGHDKPALATVDGADDYLLGKTLASTFLEECRRRLPFWRVQARNRLWQTLLHTLPRSRAGDNGKTIVAEAFSFLHRQLDVDHAFLRLSDVSGLKLFQSLHGEWAQDQQVANPLEVPILDAVLASDGKALNVATLTSDQSGIFGNKLIGKRLLGVALKPPDEGPIGVLTLVREAEMRAFSKQDEFWVERLGELLAASIGQQRHVQQLKDRQARAVEFARTMDATSDENHLCQQLADFLQQQIHGADHRASKATVRLIAPGEPCLRRYGAAGVYSESGDIPLDRNGQDNDKSIYAYVVNRCQAELIPDVTAPDYAERYENTDPGYPVHSELCVPIRAGVDGEISALGAVNLEHTEKGRYDEGDMDFVASLAAYASQALRELRHKNLARALLDWAVETHRLSSDELWEKATETLFAFCHYGVLLQLAPPDAWPDDGGDTPWRVVSVHVPMADTLNRNSSLDSWEAHLKSRWSETLVRKKLEALRCDQTPIFENHPDNFVQVDLKDARQRSNALLPLVTRDGRFIGVLVLLWFHRPALDKADREMLATFGRYCAELVAHQADWNSRENQLRLAEQRAVLARAAQQFEHVLVTRLGPVGGALNEIKADLTRAVPDAALREVLREKIHGAQLRLGQLDERSRRAVLYMRVPKFRALTVEDIWNQVVADMADKAREKTIHVASAVSRTVCRTDPEILYNLLLILADNALEAVATPGGNIWFETQPGPQAAEFIVADDGPGIPPAIRKKLFIEEGPGVSSKGTQGVALFLARQRARSMEGELDERGDANGARFVLRLPMAEEKT